MYHGQTFKELDVAIPGLLRIPAGLHKCRKIRTKALTEKTNRQNPISLIGEVVAVKL